MFNNVRDANDYKASFEVSNPLATQGISGQNTMQGTIDSRQQEVWAQEMRKAEDRCQMFKDQVAELEYRNREMQQ